MTTQQVADRFYELAKQGRFGQILQELYSPEAKNIEPDDAPWESMQGLDKIVEKFKAWNDSIAVYHAGQVTKPQVAGHYFTCTLKMDITRKDDSRMVIEEVAVYEVKDGKIVTDQFFY